jgi:hypothetical protein
MADTVYHLDVDNGPRFFAQIFTISDEAKAISAEMTKVGLQPQTERTHLFNVFSPDDLKPVSISITPYSSQDLSREGGLSMSHGGHAQGVIVEMSGTEVVAFTHLAVSGGRVVSTRHTVGELTAAGGPGPLTDAQIQRFAEGIGRVQAAKPLIEIQPQQVRTLATVGYNALLNDQFSRQVHSATEINQLRGQSNIVAEIALFVMFRTQGSNCCSCSCSCWGSSSCSSSSG